MTLQLKKEVEILRAENTHKARELDDLKSGIKHAMQRDNSHTQSHFSNLLENQSQELCRLRRLIEEHEKRER